jgi:hypothetical protein
LMMAIHISVYSTISWLILQVSHWFDLSISPRRFLFFVIWKLLAPIPLLTLSIFYDWDLSWVLNCDESTILRFAIVAHFVRSEFLLLLKLSAALLFIGVCLLRNW